jgi:hypothetical protein
MGRIISRMGDIRQTQKQGGEAVDKGGAGKLNI